MYSLAGSTRYTYPGVCDVRPRAARIRRDYAGYAVYHRYVFFHDELHRAANNIFFYLRLVASMRVSVPF